MQRSAIGRPIPGLYADRASTDHIDSPSVCRNSSLIYCKVILKQHQRIDKTKTGKFRGSCGMPDAAKRQIRNTKEDYQALAVDLIQ